ncbi:MAG: Rieske (2Fe-2S) protein [Caulobacter sp.]|nr:Rieske (2Fe-2S) protein [Caulobacter sp.]
MNPARPPAGTPLCRLDALEDPGARGFRFRVDDLQFAGFVVRAGGTLSGWVDSCPHAGWPLAMADRYLTREKDLILCAGHGALFRLEDGVCVAGPCAGRALEPWPVRIRDGGVETA